jgi:hypothetical protein
MKRLQTKLNNLFFTSLFLTVISSCKSYKNIEGTYFRSHIVSFNSFLILNKYDSSFTELSVHSRELSYRSVVYGKYHVVGERLILNSSKLHNRNCYNVIESKNQVQANATIYVHYPKCDLDRSNLRKKCNLIKIRIPEMDTIIWGNPQFMTLIDTISITKWKNPRYFQIEVNDIAYQSYYISNRNANEFRVYFSTFDVLDSSYNYAPIVFENRIYKIKNKGKVIQEEGKKGYSYKKDGCPDCLVNSRFYKLFFKNLPLNNSERELFSNQID